MLTISRAILYLPLAPCRIGSHRRTRQVGLARLTTVVCLSCTASPGMITGIANVQIYLHVQISAQTQIRIQIQVALWTITIHFHPPTRGHQAILSKLTMRLCLLFCPVIGQITTTTLSHHHLTINMTTNVRGQCQLPWLDWS